MTFTYTNRKGQTYYLSRRVAKSGAPRYVLSQNPGGQPLDALPDGLEVRENVNGQVSVGPVRPRIITVEEEQVVLRKLAALKPLYRLEVKEDTITIHEPTTTVDTLLRVMGQGLPPAFVESRRSSMEAFVATYGQYTPVFMFELQDEDTRQFVARRMTYRGEGGWSHALNDGPLETLADLYLPYLGTEALFELY